MIYSGIAQLLRNLFGQKNIDIPFRSNMMRDDSWTGVMPGEWGSGVHHDNPLINAMKAPGFIGQMYTDEEIDVEKDFPEIKANILAAALSGNPDAALMRGTPSMYEDIGFSKGQASDWEQRINNLDFRPDAYGTSVHYGYNPYGDRELGFSEKTGAGFGPDVGTLGHQLMGKMSGETTFKPIQVPDEYADMFDRLYRQQQQANKPINVAYADVTKRADKWL